MAKLEQMQATGMGEHIKESQAIHFEIQSNLASEEVKWKQWAKQHWL